MIAGCTRQYVRYRCRYGSRRNRHRLRFGQHQSGWDRSQGDRPDCRPPVRHHRCLTWHHQIGRRLNLRRARNSRRPRATYLCLRP